MGVIATVDRLSHAKQIAELTEQIAELKAEHELEINEIEKILAIQHQAETMAVVGEWLKGGDDFNWKMVSMMQVWHLYKNADKINGRATLVEKVGPQPVSKLAGDLLLALECSSFEEFVDRFRKMETLLEFQPAPFTVPNSPEYGEMREFVNGLLKNSK